MTSMWHKQETAGDEPFARRFQRVKASIHRQIVETIDLAKLGRWRPDRLRQEVRSLAEQLSRTASEPLSAVDQERLVKEIIDEVFGMGPLEPLLHDHTISDILVNGPGQVFVERRGRLEPTDIVFADNAHLMMIIQRIAARLGRRIDEMSPMVDARLPDGSRVNAIIPPLSLEGPVLSIRRFAERLTAEDLLANSTLMPQMLTFLQACAEARVSVLVSGGTGSGKTTLLNVLSRFIPAEERLITIEDSAELMLQRKHVIRLETRPANMEGAGEVTQRELVRNALRMRPDRIIVGEVRGAEALDMLQAMNTGHEGSLTTIHANDTRDALSRLEMMVMMAGFELPVPVIRQYVSSAISVVVQLARLKGGRRRVLRVSELMGVEQGSYVLRDLFTFKQLGVRDGMAFGDFHATGEKPSFLPRLLASGVDLPEHLFEQKAVPALDD
jgi:pilus assembly protein CpaF